jgi:pimeloyl-ACP methyl ester carboxylesterase
MTTSDLIKAVWKSVSLPMNGLNVHRVEAGPPNGPLLILLHGFPEFWWAWRHQIQPLAEAGYHVVVPDMRGYNLSDAPKEVVAYRLDVLTADVLALAGFYDVDRFCLVGHDWGGIVAWSVAAQHPDRIERLVIMDAPHPAVMLQQAFKHPAQAVRSSYVGFFALPWLPEMALGAFGYAGLKNAMSFSAMADTFKGSSLDPYVAAWARPGRLTGMLNYYRALRMSRPRAPARIAAPTLVLWGERDSALEVHLAKASIELCEKGRLVVVDGATHWLHLEAPQRINKELAAFLSGAH